MFCDNRKKSCKYLSRVTRKPVFGVCNQVRLKPACAVTPTTYSLQISAIASTGIILSRQRTTKVLIRLRGCSGWSAQCAFVVRLWQDGFSHDVAHLMSVKLMKYGCCILVYHYLKRSRHLKNCCNYPKIWTSRFYRRVMSPKVADGMTNSVDPDQSDLDLYCLPMPICSKT